MPSTHRRADHYEWFSGYLETQGAKSTVRVLMGGIAGAMSLAVLILIAGLDDLPTSRLAPMWFAFGGGLAGVALWLWRWPTRTQSLLFAAVTSASIGAMCIAYPDPLAALLGCIAFATNGAYVAFFHSSRVVLANFAVAAVVGGVNAWEIAVGGRPALAAVDLFLVLQINIVMPLATQLLLRALELDLKHADLDPLTGLLNRRAFHRETSELVTRRDEDDRYLIVAMVDLDDFKALNDTHGHVAGDRALVDVADALRLNATSTAVIGRSGGEEFLIADVASSPRTTSDFHRFCTAVAALPAGVTASIGTVYATLDSSLHSSVESIVDHLIAAADGAMYTAKRKGGNRCHHHGLWPAPDPDAAGTEV
ncbi:GGDEF domain-containing protein [Mycolicibacterium vaccae]|uniref:GGDEF domain-containing protein n=1 Tax=Mycolicibacterium vaccae TaxID=1810 RepID=UPI003CEFD813